jgi:AmmeMemoRadiSam system protein A
MIMGLSSLEKRVLIDLARSAATGFIQKGLGNSPAVDTSGLPKALMEKKGLFVSIYKLSELRGCMGTILPVLPIWQACMENALNAAYKDTRFPPLHVNELGYISFEITIINTPRLLSDISQVTDGIHGLILTQGFRREVFLPGSLKDVPMSMCIEEIFESLRAKAEIVNDEPEAAEVWEVFEAVVISDRNEGVMP